MVLVLLPRKTYKSTVFQKQKGLCACEDDTGLLPGETLPEPALPLTDPPGAVVTLNSARAGGRRLSSCRCPHDLRVFFRALAEDNVPEIIRLMPERFPTTSLAQNHFNVGGKTQQLMRIHVHCFHTKNTGLSPWLYLNNYFLVI